MIPTKKFGYYNYGSIRVRSRGYVPHVEADGGIYSITYHLADALPLQVSNRLRDERERLRKRAWIDREQLDRLFARQIDEQLDRGLGRCWMRDPRIAKIVRDSILHFDGQRYDLFAWSVMPNHVHVVMRLYRGAELARVLQSWKSFSGRESLSLLPGVPPPFWQREYFDRLIRDEQDLVETVEYVGDNPRKAGLTDWPWTWRGI